MWPFEDVMDSETINFEHLRNEKDLHRTNMLDLQIVERERRLRLSGYIRQYILDSP